MGMKYLQTVPIVIVCILTGCSWYELLSNGFPPRPQHWAAIILCAANVVVYFKNFRAGLVGTGIVLVLASLALISMTHEITHESYNVGIGGLKISTPSLNLPSLGLLLLHCILNFTELRSVVKRVWNYVDS